MIHASLDSCGLRTDAAKHPAPDFSHEAALSLSGCSRIAGVDEVGRGPLAGPVVAAAVVLDDQNIPAGLNDSKKVPPAKRQALFLLLMQYAEISVATASPLRIDRDNIRQASLDCMRRALCGLTGVQHALIDGRDVPQDCPCAATTLIGGDARSLSIAAASIVAKVIRDRMMVRAALTHSHYGFERHVGYGTREHLTAIAAHGPCSLHRRSFRPLRKS